MSTYLIDRAVEAQLSASLAKSAARTLRFEMKLRPSAPHPKGKGWLNAEKAHMLGLIIQAATRAAEAERLIDEATEDCLQEYDELIQPGQRDETRSIVRRRIVESVAAEHRRIARGEYGERVPYRVRHQMLAALTQPRA